MKSLICYMRVLISFICLLSSSSMYAQTRKGDITPNSSEAQCRQYFNDNLLLLDPIEGIYDCSIIPYYYGGNQLIGIRQWGGQEQATTAIIKKQSSGEYICIIKYGDRLGIVPNPYIKNLGETNAYRFAGSYVEKYSHFGNSGTLRFSIADRFIYSTNNFTVSFTGNDAFHMVKMEISFIKIIPTASMYEDAIKTEISKRQEQEKVTDWSGSGFALNNGYICTNYHVIDGAKSIKIHGIQGDFTTSYSAKVIASDKFNDLAILKVDDVDFKGFGAIPYKVKTSMADVGEEIFVLGYPMTTTMGDEIKLTTGVVSSRTGFQGDVSLYQISAPIQPGNSGGPLFDSQGTLIGIVSAKHTGAENVGYAIKASYLRNLMESSLTEDVLPTNNSVSSLPLTEKVKKVKDFVYFIECNANGRVLSIDETSKNEHKVRKRGPNGEIMIEHPNCESTTSYNCVIDKIIITDEYTIIDIIANNSIKGGGYYQYCNVSPNIHIRHLNSVYKLIKAEGIDISPQKTFFQRINQDIHFQLFFEPICIDAENIDLIEGANSDWNWYNIKIY